LTDWWANINRRGQQPDKSDFAAMAMAQNDVYMVCAQGGCHEDNTLACLADGSLQRAELQRNAGNICKFLLKTNAMKRLLGTEMPVEICNRPAEDTQNDAPVVFYTLDGTLELDLSHINTDKGESYAFALIVEQVGFYHATITASSTLGELAQIPVTLFSMGTPNGTFTFNGTGGKPVSITKKLPMFSRYTATRLYFAQSGLHVHSIRFTLIDTCDDATIMQ